QGCAAGSARGCTPSATTSRSCCPRKRPSRPELGRLDRLQLGLMAAIAATCPVSIFAAQSVGLSLAVLVFLVRLARGRTRLERSPLDGPILAFTVWTLLSAAFSPDPLTSHESAKKLVLFALFYLSVEA